MEKSQKIFKGYLILVIGNSGSGKDSIMNGVKDNFSSNSINLHLARRYITRTSSDTEDNIAISPEDFKKKSLEGKFSLEWHIYGLDYGVPIEIDSWLEKGHIVLVNVSRTIIKKARDMYKNIKVIFIKVPFEITLNRIKERGRESGERLEERIDRAKNNQNFHNADLIIDNSGALEDAVSKLHNYILSLIF